MPESRQARRAAERAAAKAEYGALVHRFREVVDGRRDAGHVELKRLTTPEDRAAAARQIAEPAPGTVSFLVFR